MLRLFTRFVMQLCIHVYYAWQQKNALTGLNNRSQFNDSLAQRLERCRRQHRPFSLMLLDLDNFKQVNDNFGHKIGDDVLQEFANVS